MTPAFIAEAVQTLKSAYTDHMRTAVEAGRTLVRIDDVELYDGCKPFSTTMLIALDPTQAKPHVYVQPGQLLANGKAPRSASTVTVGGEPWMQFSFNIPWEEKHGIIRFIAAARQRFAQND